MPKDKGFTLVELLVVISIIAILAVVGVTVFSGVQKSARINSTKEELRRLQQAMIRYKINNGELPPIGDSCPGCCDGADEEIKNTCRANAMANEPLGTGSGLSSTNYGGPYISNSEEFISDAWGRAYYYNDNDANIPDWNEPCEHYTPGNGSSGISALSSSGPDKISGTGDDINFDIRCP